MEILKSVNLYQVMSMLKLKINVKLPQLLCIAVLLPFLRLIMANLSDLVGFALTLTTHYEETRVESSFSTAPASNRFSPKN